MRFGLVVACGLGIGFVYFVLQVMLPRRVVRPARHRLTIMYMQLATQHTGGFDLAFEGLNYAPSVVLGLVMAHRMERVAR